MIQKLLLVAAVSSLFIVSCSNEAELNSLSKEGGLHTKALASDVDYQIVNYAGEDCFQFKNDSVYNEILLKISDMSEDEINSFSSGLGFISQQQIMKDADKEQLLIVDAFEEDPSRPWPSLEIKEFKQKYKDICLFNPFDSTDFVANYKVKNPISRSFANRKGVFLIGDSVVQCPEYTSEELFSSPIKTRGKNETTDKNSVHKAESKYQIPGGDFVKVRALWNFGRRSIGNDYYQYIDIDFLSQKKKVLWKKHNAKVMLRFTGWASGGGLQIYDKTHTRFDNQNGKIVTLGIDTYDKLNVDLGRFGEDKIPSGPVVGPFLRFSLTGDMSIWSNEIPESNKGLGKLYIHENW